MKRILDSKYGKLFTLSLEYRLRVSKGKNWLGSWKIYSGKLRMEIVFVKAFRPHVTFRPGGRKL